MPAKDKHPPQGKKTPRKTPEPLPPKEPESPPADSKTRKAEEQFVRGVVTRGEAAKPVDGQLPPGATHEIVEEKEGELPKIQRKRFSMF